MRFHGRNLAGRKGLQAYRYLESKWSLACSLDPVSSGSLRHPVGAGSRCGDPVHRGTRANTAREGYDLGVWRKGERILPPVGALQLPSFRTDPIRENTAAWLLLLAYMGE